MRPIVKLLNPPKSARKVRVVLAKWSGSQQPLIAMPCIDPEWGGFSFTSQHSEQMPQWRGVLMQSHLPRV